jgi:phosphonate transport system ATP-binding protein
VSAECRRSQPSAGEIWLAGTNLCSLEGEKLRRARLELAMISQHASLVRRSTVLTNVATGALGRHFGWRTALGGLPASELKAARGYLTDVGLPDLAEQRASMLSGGEAQRVAIARSLAQRPRMIRPRSIPSLSGGGGISAASARQNGA